MSMKKELIVTNDAHFNVLKTIDYPLVDVKTIQQFLLDIEELSK